MAADRSPVPVEVLDLLADVEATCRTREGALATAERLREMLAEGGAAGSERPSRDGALTDAVVRVLLAGRS